MSKLVVFGGAGFLGKRICQEGIENGLKVTSLTRSGRPPKNASLKDAHWIARVQWKSADIFKPETYKPELKDAENVVHSMGILLENQNYKNSINSNNSILNEFTNFLKPSNPMQKNPYMTYEAMNRDSAVLLAETLREESNVDTPGFVYISADKGFPGLPKGYIVSKREAEVELQMLKHIRTIIMRPGFMIDENSNNDSMRDTIEKLVNTLDFGNRLVLGKKFEMVNNLVRPTVSTQTVAKTIIKKLNDKSFQGVVPLEDILVND